MLEILHKGSKACFIDDTGRDHVIPIFSVGRYLAEGRYVVKVEGLEQEFKHIIEKLKITENHSVHCYISPKFAKSFDVHTDPIDVFIYCLEGTKVMSIDEQLVYIEPETFVRIPANTPHRALNIFDSTMLSIGVEK